MTWIPCATSLPEPGEDVLLCIAGRPWVSCGCRGESPDDWCHYSQHGTIPCLLIPTHWQPKPRPAP